MKLPNLIKSKGFKIYFVIGVLLYIIPYLFGITNAMRIYLEHKTIFSDYIEEIKNIYISEDRDIAMCVQGNTSGQFDIEYWVYIKYSQYQFTKDNFHHDRVTDLTGVDHGLIKKQSCNDNPWVDKKFYKYELAIKYLSELPEDTNQLMPEMFDINQMEIDKDTLFVEQKSNYSQIALVRFIDENKKIGTLFMMSNIHYPDQLNPLWYLLYIPAFILDILLWPMYLVLVLYSAFLAPMSR
jgi:hypothetical protein